MVKKTLARHGRLWRPARRPRAYFGALVVTRPSVVSRNELGQNSQMPKQLGLIGGKDVPVFTLGSNRQFLDFALDARKSFGSCVGVQELKTRKEQVNIGCCGK